MKLIKHTTASLMALAALSACATPNPPTVTAGDVDRAFAQAQRISVLPETNVSDLPTGTVTYDGQIGANVRGDAQGSILADMTMIVGFSNNNISGNVNNINLIDPDGTPNQRLDGTLQIAGVESSGNLDAVASGEVTGVDVDGFVVDSQMNLDLNGAVHNDLINGDAIYGTAEGEANGDFYLDIDGVFFGTER
jgi:hypothetical protein